jgi:phenylpropionate dioxygenase-like ring-hydroxylating dioxygenase large terminal subunit
MEPLATPPAVPAPRPGAGWLPDQWFVACVSSGLRARPVGVVIQGTALVLFRDAAGLAAALQDRCPHRNAPLSAGEVRAGALECPYHGWRFDAAGGCLAVPGLEGPPGSRAARAVSHPCREGDGYVWVGSTPGAPPARDPARFPLLDAPGYTTVRRALTVRGTLHAALENTLDVPHTAFLHGGLFRTRRAPRAVDVVVRRFADRCEAEYLGEPCPEGLVGRLLAPGGGVVQHVDRFLLPSVAQVEYRLGQSHLVATTAMTPVDAERTRLFAAVTFRLPGLPVPGWLVAAALAPLAGRILAQDARMLRLQSETVARFGGERFASTEADLLGPQVARLLRRAERGEAPEQAGPAVDGPEHAHEARLWL